MPTYEYECKKCGHRFEARHNMRDENSAQCPECNGEVRRLMSAPAGFIKGSGGQGLGIQCGRDETCCGRQIPCGKRPCDH